MQYLLIIPALAGLYWLYLQIRALFLSNKQSKQQEAVKEARHESEVKSNIADSSYNDFKRMYDDYVKSKQPK